MVKDIVMAAAEPWKVYVRDLQRERDEALEELKDLATWGTNFYAYVKGESPSLVGGESEVDNNVYKFYFALESARAFLARIVLAKELTP